MSRALRVAKGSGRGGTSTGTQRASEGFDLRREDGWLTLTRRERFVGDPLRDLLGRPGLWRALQQGPHCALVFDIPSAVDLEGEGGADEERSSAALLGWGGATADGTLRDWQAPAPPEELEGWVEPGRRHVRAGGHVAPLELVAEPERLALRAPTLVRIPDPLCATRRAWLEEACADAQEKWRMVRFGIDEASACVRAEVDLSGAPPALARALVELGLAALGCAAGWALPGLALLADPDVPSRLLDRRPRRAGARRDNHPKEERA